MASAFLDSVMASGTTMSMTMKFLPDVGKYFGYALPGLMIRDWNSEIMLD